MAPDVEREIRLSLIRIERNQRRTILAVLVVAGIAVLPALETLGWWEQFPDAVQVGAVLALVLAALFLAIVVVVAPIARLVGWLTAPAKRRMASDALVEPADRSIT